MKLYLDNKVAPAVQKASRLRWFLTADNTLLAKSDGQYLFYIFFFPTGFRSLVSVWHGGSRTLPVFSKHPSAIPTNSEAPTEQLAVKTVNGETFFFFLFWGGGQTSRRQTSVARSSPIKIRRRDLGAPSPNGPHLAEHDRIPTL